MNFIASIKHRKTFLLLAGALASLGFPPVYALPLFALTLILALYMCDEAKNYMAAAKIGYWFGFGFFCAGFYWIGNALLVDISTFGWLYPIALLSFGAFFGLFFIPPFCAWYYFKNTNIWSQILAFASVMVLSEYLRSFLLTGFSWNMLGTMLAFSDIFIQTASLIGTYGLSFLLILFVLSFSALLKKHYRSSAGVILMLLILMTAFGTFHIKSYNHSLSDLTVRLVQPSIPQSMKWEEDVLEDNLMDYINLTRTDGLNEVDFVLWGETATAFNPTQSLYYQMLIQKAVPQNGYLLTGLLRYDQESEAMYNSLSVIDDKGDTLAFYDKHHLVPFGEYIPLRSWLPKWVQPVAAGLEDLSRGQKYKTIKVSGLPPFGALICYEVIFPDNVLNRKNKPAFLVIVSNDGWYGKSFGPYQHLVSAKMRAVEEGITVVRAANNGISAVINPLGQTVGRLGLNKRGILDVRLPQTLSVHTLYASIGDKTVQLMMLAILCFLIWQKYRHSFSKKKPLNT